MKKCCGKLGIMLVMSLFGLMALGSGSTDASVDKEISNVEAPSASNSTDSTESAAADEEGVSIDEVVLLDQDNVKITATGIEDGFMGTKLKLLIENNSDKNLTFQVRNASVNGFMVDTMMSADVAAGKKANDGLTFTTSGLKECGIDLVASMEFSFHIFTSEEWADYLDSDMITVETSAAASYTQVYDDSGEVFYDQDGIKIIGKGISSEDSFFGPGLIVYIENNTDGNFTVQVRDTSVNGFMVDANMSEDVISGKKAIAAVTFFNNSLAENGIEDITEVETSFHVFNMDSWETIVDTEPIKINFQQE